MRMSSDMPVDRTNTRLWHPTGDLCRRASYGSVVPHATTRVWCLFFSRLRLAHGTSESRVAGSAAVSLPSPAVTVTGRLLAAGAPARRCFMRFGFRRGFRLRLWWCVPGFRVLGPFLRGPGASVFACGPAFLGGADQCLDEVGVVPLVTSLQEPADIKSSKRDMTRSLWWVVKQRPV